MNPRLFLIVLPLMLLVVCASCSDFSRKRGARAAADKFFKEVSAPSPKTEETWGMTEVAVFGREFGLAGATEVQGVSDQPGVYKVTIPFWCEGKDRDGRVTALQRTLHLHMTLRGENEWTITNHQFTDDGPLTFDRQVGSWLLWSFLVVFLPGGVLATLRESAPMISLILVLTVLSVVGYLAYHAFGSWWAVPICIIVYVVLWILIVCVLAVAVAVKNSL